MASWPDIAAAVKDTLSQIRNIEFYDLVPTSFVTPCIILEPTAADWEQTMGRGYVRYTATLTVLVSLAETGDAQERLHGLLAHAGTDSIPTLIMATPGLGLTDETHCKVTGWRNFGPVEISERSYLRAEIPVEIQTKGTA